MKEHKKNLDILSPWKNNFRDVYFWIGTNVLNISPLHGPLWSISHYLPRVVRRFAAFEPVTAHLEWYITFMCIEKGIS